MNKKNEIKYICPYCGHVGKVKGKLSDVIKDAKNGKDVFCSNCDAVVTGAIFNSTTATKKSSVKRSRKKAI